MDPAHRDMPRCPIVIVTALWHWHWNCMRQTNPVQLGRGLCFAFVAESRRNKSDGSCWGTRVCQENAKLTSNDLSIGWAKHDTQFSQFVTVVRP
jgi:hypothetical protein